MISGVNTDPNKNDTQTASKALLVGLSTLFICISILFAGVFCVPTNLMYTYEKPALNYQSAPAREINEEHRSMCTLDNAFRGLWKYDFNTTEQLQWCPHTCDLYELTRNETNECLRGKLIVLMGDSTMTRSFNALHDFLFPEEVVNTTEYCAVFNVTLKNKTCGSVNRPNWSTRFTGRSAEDIFIEKLWLKNVKTSSPAAAGFNTTQEMIFDYLQKKSPDILFINIGLHRTCESCVKGVESNLGWMLELFKKLGSDMFWLQTTGINMVKQPEWAIQNTSGPSTTNVQVEKLNAIARGITNELDIPVVDAWPPGNFLDYGLHRDGVHLRAEYYTVVMRTWLSTYCKRAKVKKSCMGVKVKA